MRSGQAPLLEAVGLSKRYGSREALKDVSLETFTGELVACIGPNGAGKTTLLTILAGIQPADAGVVRRPAGRIGWVPQQPAVYGKLSVTENLRLFARLEEVADVEEAVGRMLTEAGLEERADEQVARLSGGNRQRVNVAIGLLAAPSLLLLDEPSASLDPRQRERLWGFIGRLTDRGTSVLYSTHTVAEAERYADRVLVLADGERLFAGTPHELQETVVGEGGRNGHDDFEQSFVAFLRQRGH
jgi:ABC-2 type transport system ATP-binding protein